MGSNEDHLKISGHDNNQNCIIGDEERKSKRNTGGTIKTK